MEGGLVVGYDSDSNHKLDALVWSMRLTLSTGEVDLSESAIEISLYIANLTEVTLNYNSSLDDETDFEDVNMTQGTYGMKFVDQVHTNEILDPGEIVRMYVMVNRTTHEVSANDRLMIVIISSVAMIKVTKTAPVGIEPGMNILR